MVVPVKRMDIRIQDRQNRHRSSDKRIRAQARTILSDLGVLDGELSILIVDDQEIAELNKTYLDRDGPTNVIAFSMKEGSFGNINPNLLGDVVISVDTAAREAQDAGISAESRFDQLLVHGILHLLGFDHSKSSHHAEAMAVKEKQLLKLLQNP